MALGNILKEARLRKNFTTSEVASETRMKIQLVQAIEDEDYNAFPAAIYGKGFIKLYAECVDVAPAPLIDEYVNALSNKQTPKPATQPIPQPKSRRTIANNEPLFGHSEQTKTEATQEEHIEEANEPTIEEEPILQEDIAIEIEEDVAVEIDEPVIEKVEAATISKPDPVSLDIESETHEEVPADDLFSISKPETEELEEATVITPLPSQEEETSLESEEEDFFDSGSEEPETVDVEEPVFIDLEPETEELEPEPEEPVFEEDIEVAQDLDEPELEEVEPESKDFETIELGPDESGIMIPEDDDPEPIVHTSPLMKKREADEPISMKKIDFSEYNIKAISISVGVLILLIMLISTISRCASRKPVVAPENEQLELAMPPADPYLK